MSSLADRQCSSCRAGAPSLSDREAEGLLRELDRAWRIGKDRRLEREFAFPDFASALSFTNRIGALAEEEGHHPDIQLAWGRVALSLWTHSSGGLSEADFILAAKIDRLVDSRARGS
jgi:4a-hydroxytetrahydrobiopterin dehydratase